MIMDEHNININDDKIWRLSEVTGEYLPGDRYGHGAVTLENGQILVIGGKTRHVLNKRIGEGLAQGFVLLNFYCNKNAIIANIQ